ncbi:hypothetical protein ACQP1G_46050 [Nocardia sp. CA-107356]|uniref:hypothetical protein n=1 Tax=Nocardia sp. CA-107356 TaxID=3239972 RepID=UPI003D9265D0
MSNLAAAHMIGAPESLFHMKHEVLDRRPDHVSHETWDASSRRRPSPASTESVGARDKLGALALDQAGAIRVIDFPIRWHQVQNVT